MKIKKVLQILTMMNETGIWKQQGAALEKQVKMP